MKMICCRRCNTLYEMPGSAAHENYDTGLCIDCYYNMKDEDNSYQRALQVKRPNQIRRQ